ncbi:uncharacterized protein DNG_01904 [Cephalotrichum gorgonifer]|uniref:Wings apart-like protein C-terminal domain-containing protein n=1 Tax=Cephalotrichum gorgonifer TaxID=2041049 RepID=A0AAE8MSF5_9PEZI|nr:uncharacterized protein DNG_01904 [Cephalotrichum gorgonifer]
MRPTPTPAKRKRPGVVPAVAGIENSGNATAETDADPYDIMSFDNWTAPRAKTPAAHEPSPKPREFPKKRAPVATKDKYRVPAKVTKAAPVAPRPLPTVERPANRKEAATVSTAPPRPLPTVERPANRREAGSGPTVPPRSLQTEGRPANRKETGPLSTVAIRRSVQSKGRQPKAETATTTVPNHVVAPIPRRRESSASSADEQSPPRPKRPRSGRIIDALVDQAEESSDDEFMHAGVPRARQDEATSSLARSEISESPSRRADPTPKTPGSVKFTYGAQRSILQVAGSGDPHGDIALMPPLPVSLPKASSSGLEFSFSPPEESEDEDTSHKGAVRSIHELRQAGANNRFADEIDDLLERIGSPRKEGVSLRRNALLEMALKLHQKHFLRQFRDYGTHGRLFDQLDQEDDIASGFALVSALLTLLTANAAPRASKYLQAGISKLLRKLLCHEEDISSMANQRSMNLSRNTRATITSLKSAMLKLDVWDSPVPTTISPRSLSLKFISVAFKSPDGPACKDAFGDLADDLFSILRLVTEPSFLEDCSDAERADCVLVASVLQELSVGAVTSKQSDRWTEDYPVTISAALDAALQRRSSLLGSFEDSLLKLAMNCTNNSEPAASAWAQPGRLDNLARSTCTCFSSVKDAVTRGEWDADGYNRLLLILGLMINLCEHTASSRMSLEDDVLDSLIRAYLESYSSTKEADSVEKTQLNVAVGYLAIVLGYLSLSTPVRQRLEAMNRMDGLDRIADSISEFLAFYESVDNRKDAGEHVGRLMGLVETLKG